MKDARRQQRTNWLLATAMLMLCGVTVWTFNEMDRKRERALQSMQVTNRCLEIAEQMPQQTETHIESGYVQTEVLWSGKLMEEAATRAGLPEKTVQVSLDQAPRRVANTNYLEQDFTVQLGDLTLPQVVTFLAALDSTDAKFVIKQLDLAKAGQNGEARANADASTERWTPRNLVLSYYIISRNSKASKR